MKLKKVVYSLSLLLAATCFSACKEDDDDKKDEPTDSGTDPQDQIYLQNVTAGKPLLVIYGDSISTGVLANTKLGQNIDNSLLQQLGNYIKDGRYNTEGFQNNLANQDRAASTTENAYGLRAAIAAKAGITAAEVGVVSFAKFGAKAVDIPEMLARWNKEETDSIKRKPDYILIALGGNDFCSPMTVEEITKTFHEQVDAVQKTAPDAQLIISPAPPVYQLAAIDFTYGPTISQITGEELSCKKFREQFCQRVYEPDAQARLQGINQGIQAAFDRQKAQGAKVSLATGVLNWKIVADELAFDCFHPSEAGQGTLGAYWTQALPQ